MPRFAVTNLLNLATQANLTNSDACEKLERYGPIIFREEPEESKFKMSLTKKFCATASARESVKFRCKKRCVSKVRSTFSHLSELLAFIIESSNDITFYNIDFYNSTSVYQLNQNCPLAFYAHGFLAGCSGNSTAGLLNAWTDEECINVCCVDWSLWSDCNYCESATDYVYRVGEYLAEIILFSANEYGFRTKTLVGHSLGAHVIGECGRNINNPQVPECYCNIFKSSI